MTFTHFHRFLFIIGTIINLILKGRKMRLREVWWLVQGHKARRLKARIEPCPKDRLALSQCTHLGHFLSPHTPLSFWVLLAISKVCYGLFQTFSALWQKEVYWVIWSSALRPPSFPSWCVWQSPQQIHMDLPVDTNLPSSLLHTKSSRPLAMSNAWS